MSNGVTHRRIFLKQIATTVGAVPLGLRATVVTGGIAATVAPSAKAQDPAPIAHAWHFFDGNEGRAAEAAVAVVFIDHQPPMFFGVSGTLIALPC